MAYDFTKDPDDVLDYTWNFTEFLAEITDTIASKSFIVEDVSMTVGNSQIVDSAKRVTAMISGGTLDNVFGITCRIVTAGGRTKDKTMYFRIKKN